MSKFRILSIDGGGIKGAIPAAFLAHLESHLEKPIVEYFDLIAGTSTGGIIALGLTAGLEAKEISQFYTEKGPDIFKSGNGSLLQKYIGGPFRWWKQLLFSTKFTNEDLNEAVTSVFGERYLGDAKTRLLIPSYNGKINKVYLFRTAHHERLRNDYLESMVNVAMATAAAPTYFPSKILDSGVELIDGGVWANNPVSMAVVEAITTLNQRPENIHVLSLGCASETFQIEGKSSKLGLKDYAIDLFMKGQSVSSENIAKLLLDAFFERPQAFHRYNPVVPHKVYTLDDASKVVELAGIGVHEAREAFEHLKPIFFDQTVEPFEPVHRIKGISQKEQEWDLK